MSGFQFDDRNMVRYPDIVLRNLSLEVEKYGDTVVFVIDGSTPVRISNEDLTDLAWSILEMQGKAECPEEPIKPGDFVTYTWGGRNAYGKVTGLVSDVAYVLTPGEVEHSAVDVEALTRISAHEFTEAIAEIVNEMVGDE